MISKVLIANRGEIACRIARSIKPLRENSSIATVLTPGLPGYQVAAVTKRSHAGHHLRVEGRGVDESFSPDRRAAGVISL